jgi:hypothetical protein
MKYSSITHFLVDSFVSKLKQIIQVISINKITYFPVISDKLARNDNFLYHLSYVYSSTQNLKLNFHFREAKFVKNLCRCYQNLPVKTSANPG